MLLTNKLLARLQLWRETDPNQRSVTIRFEGTDSDPIIVIFNKKIMEGAVVIPENQDENFDSLIISAAKSAIERRKKELEEVS